LLDRLIADDDGSCGFGMQAQAEGAGHPPKGSDIDG
jgi:hypothetical protein